MRARPTARLRGPARRLPPDRHPAPALPWRPLAAPLRLLLPPWGAVMTTTTTATASQPSVRRLGPVLVRNASGNRDCAAAQALAEEETLLAHPGVRSALVAKVDGRVTARWEGLMGRLYTLGLDEQQRAFLGLVLSMVGI